MKYANRYVQYKNLLAIGIYIVAFNAQMEEIKNG